MKPARKILWTVSVLSGLLGAGSAFAGKTLSVEEGIVLPAKPAEVWKVVGDYGNLQAWHPVVGNTTVTQGKNNQVGAVRTVETKDGAKIVEKLLAYDGKRMSMRYKIVESPLPVSEYSSNLKVVAAGEGSRVIWNSRFKANGTPDAKAREVISGVYKAGFEGLQSQFGGS